MRMQTTDSIRGEAQVVHRFIGDGGLGICPHLVPCCECPGLGAAPHQIAFRRWRTRQGRDLYARPHRLQQKRKSYSESVLTLDTLTVKNKQVNHLTIFRVGSYTL